MLQAVLGVWTMSAGIGLLLAPAPLLGFAHRVNPVISDGVGPAPHSGQGLATTGTRARVADTPWVPAAKVDRHVDQGGWLDVLDLAEIAAKVYAEAPEIGHSAN